MAQAGELLSMLTRLRVSCGPRWAARLFEATRPQLPAASFNDVAAVLCLGISHGPPPTAWLNDASPVFEQKV